jgi:predicted site-specific integrase-resolvase
MEQLFSTRDTASLLDVTVRAIENWRLKGLLTPVKAGGRCRYPESELERFLGSFKSSENKSEHNSKGKE